MIALNRFICQKKQSFLKLIQFWSKLQLLIVCHGRAMPVFHWNHYIFKETNKILGEKWDLTIAHPATKFHQNEFRIFWVTLLTNKQFVKILDDLTELNRLNAMLDAIPCSHPWVLPMHSVVMSESCVFCMCQRNGSPLSLLCLMIPNSPETQIATYKDNYQCLVYFEDYFCLLSHILRMLEFLVQPQYYHTITMFPHSVWYRYTRVEFLHPGPRGNTYFIFVYSIYSLQHHFHWQTSLEM